ncbi:MAG: carboxymuconolactone decarboxylase family protein [Rhodospirillaceae bacterium]|nr:MAG: carboxymuconolactone decarboxylase family protein [Rhodospirillaceae bacterium]
MTIQNPTERTQKGIHHQTELLAAAAPEPGTLFEASWRDYIFAEVWTRPGLDRRSRYLIAISGAASAHGAVDMLEGYIRGALTLGELTLSELREAVLHFAVYRGWSQASVFDRAVTSVAKALNLPPASYAPIRAEPWDPKVRHAEGAANFNTVMVFPGPPPVTAYFEGGIINFVFGEMWTRPGLDQRARRWITLACVADSASDMPIRSHVYSAMASGDATREEMHEFVLQYAVHGGWPRASVMQGAVLAQADRVAKGLPFEP